MSKSSSFRSTRTKEASQVLDSTVRKFRLQKKLDQYEGVLFWAEIAGDKFADVSKPGKISRAGILEVRVIDATWCQEMSLSKVSLIESWNAHEKTSPINDMRFVAGNPKDFK